MGKSKKGGGKAKEKKDAKQKKSKSSSLYKLYEVSGSSLNRKNKTCPKCGAGTYLAEHKDRNSCGKCGYTEFKK